MNELAGAALPSQKFGANAAWLRLNVMLYNLLSAYKRVGLPEELHPPDPSGCGSCSLTPSEKCPPRPASPCCAAPNTSLKPSLDHHEPFSPSSALPQPGFEA